MRQARVLVHGIEAGIFQELEEGGYAFVYHPDYIGPAVSLTMPVIKKHYEFDKFPPFFEGLLPEGHMLEALLRKYKVDNKDYFSQLLIVGQDVVGAVTVETLT